jgi:hypothetical protein
MRRLSKVLQVYLPFLRGLYNEVLEVLMCSRSYPTTTSHENFEYSLDAY